MDSKSSEGLDASGQTARKVTPIYNEFSVAHTSITSGLGRGRVGAAVIAQSDPDYDSQSVELEPLDLEGRLEGLSSPMPPKLQLVHPKKARIDLDLELGLSEAAKTRPFLGGLRKVLSGKKQKEMKDSRDGLAISSLYPEPAEFASSDVWFRGVNYSSRNPYNLAEDVYQDLFEKSSSSEVFKGSLLPSPAIRITHPSPVQKQGTSNNNHTGYSQDTSLALENGLLLSAETPIGVSVNHTSSEYYQVPRTGMQSVQLSSPRELLGGQIHGDDHQHSAQAVVQRGLNLANFDEKTSQDSRGFCSSSTSHTARGATYLGDFDVGTSRRPIIRHKSSIFGGEQADTLEAADFDMGPGPDVGPAAQFYTQSQQTSSMNDGSTVENIVRQYARDDDFYEVDLHSDCDESVDDGPFGLKVPSRSILDAATRRLKLSDREIRRTLVVPNLGKAALRPPRSNLPHLPHRRSPPPVAPPASSIYGPTESYDDTKKLLKIPTVSKSAEEPTTKNPIKRLLGIQLGSALSHKDSAPSTGLDWHRNPFSQKDISLERDVSWALRYQGPFNSNQTLEQTCADFLRSEPRYGPKPPKTISMIHTKAVQSKPTAKRNDRVGARSKLGFYEKSAIPNMWLDADRVRVPIKNPGFSKEDDIIRSLGEEDNVRNPGEPCEDEEWETVLGSRRASRINSQATSNSPYGHRDANYNTAGSSLADNSSQGDFCPVEIDYEHFSSTEKIISHPAAARTAQHYRVRDYGFGPTPVLMPYYKEHYVNGLPQNTSRIFSSPYQAPMPMPSGHRNPFLSSPPSNFSPKGEQEGFSNGLDGTGVPSRWKGKGVDKIRFPSLYGVDSTINRMHDEIEINKPKYPKPSYQAPFVTDDECKELMADTTDHVNEKCSQSKRYSKPPYTIIAPIRMVSLKPPKRQPPGAFYQKIRSRSGNQPRSIIVPNETNHRSASEGAVNADGTPLRAFVKQNEFVFRSPLAPVKSPEWRTLYTPEQMADNSIKACRRGVDDTGRSSFDIFGHGLNKENRRNTDSANSTRVINYAPQIQIFDRRPDDIYERREPWISCGCLCLSSSFPFFLWLYWAGMFDTLMGKLTKWQFTKMRKTHKSAAFWMAPIFLLSIITVIIVVVARQIHNNQGMQPTN